MPAAATKRRPIGVGPYLYFFVGFALTMLGLHAWLLRVPYFWDEAGQYIPAALDLFRAGAWIPQSAPPVVHPPGVMAYLALVWSAAGYSVPATRIGMLLLSSAGVLAAFLLAIELLREVPGKSAFLAVGLLVLSPFFLVQSVLAQLEAPAMLFTVLALLFFLQDQIPRSAAACLLLVLVKETGIAVPLTLGAWLLWERRRRDALWFVLPAVALAAWLAALTRTTGYWGGNIGFVQYNLWNALHPVHILFALLRRLYFLFVGNMHWIGTAAIVYAWRSGGTFRTRAWRVAWLVLAVHAVTVSALGGAVLNRYLVPVLPILYAAMAAGFSLLAPRRRLLAGIALCAGLAANNFINPPYPFAYEDNLAFADFVGIQRAAAGYLELSGVRSGVHTLWPLSGVLTRADLGYVDRPIQTVNLADLSQATLDSLDWSRVGALVAYSRDWDPPYNLLRHVPFAAFWQRCCGLALPASREEVRSRVPFPPRMIFERRGQWADIYINPEHERVKPPAQMVRQVADSRNPGYGGAAKGIRARGGTGFDQAPAACARGF